MGLEASKSVEKVMWDSRVLRATDSLLVSAGWTFRFWYVSGSCAAVVRAFLRSPDFKNKTWGNNKIISQQYMKHKCDKQHAFIL